jgi:hypothetical protein
MGDGVEERAQYGQPKLEIRGKRLCQSNPRHHSNETDSRGRAGPQKEKHGQRNATIQSNACPGEERPRVQMVPRPIIPERF